MQHRVLRKKITRLRTGPGGANETFNAGDVFEPTEAELSAFPDFLEAVREPEPEVLNQDDPVEDDEPTDDTEPDQDEPTDDTEPDQGGGGEEDEAPGASDLTLQHRGGGYYDVVRPDGSAINEKALQKEEAQELLSQGALL